MSAVIERLGATSGSSLIGCRRRVELERRPSTDSGPGPFNAPAALGDLCHVALQAVTESRAILSAAWESSLASGWDEALPAFEARLPLSVAAADVPGYELARARLGTVAARLRKLLKPLGDEVELICERPMEALGGRLVGKPDLVVLGEGVHWILDYKTGGVLDYGTDAPKSAYVSQLQLYAVLEHERTGAWPGLAYLLPFKQRTVELPIDPSACEELASRLEAALAGFNEWVPEVQPATPALEVCRWCAHACECEEVWNQADHSWSEELPLISGTVVQAAQSKVGTTTLVLDVDGGTVGEGRVAVRGEGPAMEEAGPLGPGSTIRVSGLFRRGERTFNLAPWGEIRVIPA